ncbi:unnamed protein product [Psylliodes chrysocephalus]|uniref:Uncharacterized protein n=1 Tax=Psylliodes chrysocephalus TaxID=3402493 RepID=A0A9P0GH30_9CUCU|nr:unnamed protein product [Psylliodes chrysocephala]
MYASYCQSKNMVLLLNLILFCYLGMSFGSNDVTEILHKNVLLNRRKRYLIFPKGSNLAISMAGVKALMRAQPTGFNILGEMDCPFALPTDTRLLRKSHYIKKNRREIYSTLDSALTLIGLNGTACVRKMICDAKKYVPMKGKSMIKDILLAVFDFPEEEFNKNNIKCTDELGVSCSISIMEHVLEEMNSNYD